MPYDYFCQRPPSFVPCIACQRADSADIVQRVWPTPGTNEPDTVKALFFYSAVAEWRNYMARWSPALGYGGIFVHQKPYCTFNDFGTTPVDSTVPRGTHRCELGDLLVIFTDAPARRRVAALFQAKMVGGSWPPTSTGGSQWELYHKWPTFRYTLRGPTGSGTRKLRTLSFSGGQDPAAQYLELDDTPSAQKIDCTEALQGAAWIRWDQIVDRMLNGGAGRAFSWDQASAVNEWDEFIWDLITVTATCPMPGGSGGGGGGGGAAAGGAGAGGSDRGAVQWLDELDQIPVLFDEPPPDDQAFEQGKEDEIRGISLMHFSRRGEDKPDLATNIVPVEPTPPDLEPVQAETKWTYSQTTQLGYMGG